MIEIIPTSGLVALGIFAASIIILREVVLRSNFKPVEKRKK